MKSTKTLNGLSHNLAQSYFSTLRYYDGGYMCDWIVNSAIHKGIEAINIYVLKKEIEPSELTIDALTCYLGTLKTTIAKTLKSLNLPSDFIKEVIFEIKVEGRWMYCTNYSVDINERIYKGKVYIERSEIDFKI